MEEVDYDFSELEELLPNIDVSKYYDNIAIDEESIERIKQKNYEVSNEILKDSFKSLIELNESQSREIIDLINGTPNAPIFPIFPIVPNTPIDMVKIAEIQAKNFYEQQIEIGLRIKKIIDPIINSSRIGQPNLIEIGAGRKGGIIQSLPNNMTTFDLLRNMNYFKIGDINMTNEELKTAEDLFPKNPINNVDAFIKAVKNIYEYRRIVNYKFPDLETFTLEYYDNTFSYLINENVIAIVTYFMILIERDLISPTLAMAAYSSLLSGCYIFRDNKFTKLENCNNYYQTPENMLKCKCSGINYSTDCTNNTGDDCSTPYCLGKSCKNSINNDQCKINGQNVPQCTNTNIGDPNYVYYTYLDYKPLTFIPIANFINKKFYNKYLATKGKKNNFLKYFLIFLSIILIILLIMFLYNRFLKKKKL